LSGGGHAAHPHGQGGHIDIFAVGRDEKNPHVQILRFNPSSDSNQYSYLKVVAKPQIRFNGKASRVLKTESAAHSGG
jgi:hypothetical protein